MSMGQSNNGPSVVSEGFFDLIQNAELYQARLKAIKDAEDSMRKAEESLALGREARLALNDATAAKEQAKKELADAQTKAKGILEEAAAKAKDVIDYAEARAANATEEAAATEDRLASLKASVAEVEADIASQREEAQAIQDKANAALDEANKLKADYEERVKKLKALL